MNNDGLSPISCLYFLFTAIVSCQIWYIITDLLNVLSILAQCRTVMMGHFSSRACVFVWSCQVCITVQCFPLTRLASFPSHGHWAKEHSRINGELFQSVLPGWPYGRIARTWSGSLVSFLICKMARAMPASLDCCWPWCWISELTCEKNLLSSWANP